MLRRGYVSKHTETDNYLVETQGKPTVGADRVEERLNASLDAYSDVMEAQ